MVGEVAGSVDDEEESRRKQRRQKKKKSNSKVLLLVTRVERSRTSINWQRHKNISLSLHPVVGLVSFPHTLSATNFH